MEGIMAWNFNDNAPIYLQIVSTLKGNIASGAYPPGSRLPSVRDLAMEAGVNPNTMQRALAELERSGLVNSQRTAGRFITQDAEALTRLRRSMSEHIISELFARLRALGMSDAQILEAVRQRTVRPLNDRLEC
jgi:DNA-binding transcriptional regulator YhcF (GntR family)